MRLRCLALTVSVLALPACSRDSAGAGPADLGAPVPPPDLSPPPPPPWCSDGRTDGDESDLDCGGSCFPCAEARACTTDSDCLGYTCRDRVCRPAAPCPGGFTFVPPPATPMALYPEGSALLDVDGDGLPDRVRAWRSQAGFTGVSVFRNLGRGLFDGRAASTDLAYDPVGFDVGDVDGDGLRDLVTAVTFDGLTGRLGLARSAGGARTTFRERELLTGEGGYQLLGLDDADGDGHLDVLAGFWAPGGSEELRVLRGHGDGTFAAPERYADADAYWTMVLADLDGDGHRDLVSAGSGWVRATLDRGGAFPAGPRQPWPLADGGPVRTGDLDGDGAPDLVRLHVEKSLPPFTVGEARLAIGLQRGGVVGTTAVRDVPDGVTDVAVADFDRDGLADLLLGRFRIEEGDFDGFNTIYSLRVLRNLGGLAFQPLDEQDCDRTWWGMARTSVDVADIDGDKRPDVRCQGHVLLNRCR